MFALKSFLFLAVVVAYARSSSVVSLKDCVSHKFSTDALKNLQEIEKKFLKDKTCAHTPESLYCKIIEKGKKHREELVKKIQVQLVVMKCTNKSPLPVVSGLLKTVFRILPLAEDIVHLLDPLIGNFVCQESNEENCKKLVEYFGQIYGL